MLRLTLQTNIVRRSKNSLIPYYVNNYQQDVI